MIEYSICKQYTDTPGARYINQSLYSGEDFRKNVLIPLYEQAKTENTKVSLDMDGTYGYPPSFLEEAFGGLARKFPEENILQSFVFVTRDQPSLVKLIHRIVSDAKKGKSYE